MGFKSLYFEASVFREQNFQLFFPCYNRAVGLLYYNNSFGFVSGTVKFELKLTV